MGGPRELWQQLPPGVKPLLIFATCSRVLMVVLGALFAALASPYDTSAALSPVAGPTIGWIDSAVRALLAPFANWDGVYFMRIAATGNYEFEQFYAFFPFLPIMIRFVAWFLTPLSIVLSKYSLLLVAGVLLSNVCFVLAAVALYGISWMVLRNAQHALLAAKFFCICPSGIFMSAIYTESLFAFCSFLGMYAVLQDAQATRGRVNVSRWTLIAPLAFAAAGFTRSNGLLLAGYLVYGSIVKWYGLPAHRAVAWRWALLIGLTGVQCLIVVAPYIGFQYYAYLMYCVNGSETSSWFAHLLGVTIPATAAERPWCAATLPSIYSFVQAQYWDNGLFHYYQVKQIPNFLLAAPVLTITLVKGTQLLLTHKTGIKPFVSMFLSWVRCGCTPGEGAVPGPATDVLPFIAHWMFLALFALLFMHIQVSTRFLSACPPLYWCMAVLFQEGGWARKAVVGYTAAYSVVGALLFCNFYPWT